MSEANRLMAEKCGVAIVGLAQDLFVASAATEEGPFSPELAFAEAQEFLEYGAVWFDAYVEEQTAKLDEKDE